ncbi:MAG: hypothetical protein AAFX93_10340, partial [Verrucomicrobiota bacterium]
MKFTSDKNLMMLAKLLLVFVMAGFGASHGAVNITVQTSVDTRNFGPLDTVPAGFIDSVTGGTTYLSYTASGQFSDGSYPVLVEVDNAGTTELHLSSTTVNGGSVYYENFDTALGAEWNIQGVNVAVAGGKLETDNSNVNPKVGEWDFEDYVLYVDVNLQGDFQVSTSCTYTERTDDLAQLYLYVRFSDGSTASVGMNDEWRAYNGEIQADFSFDGVDAFGTGQGTLPAFGSFTAEIVRTNDTIELYYGGVLQQSAVFSKNVVAVGLTHNVFEDDATKTASWEYLQINGIGTGFSDGLERWYRPEELDADHSKDSSVGNWRDALGGDGMSIGTSNYRPHFRKPLSHGLPGLEFNSSTHRLHGTYDHLNSQDSLTIAIVYAQNDVAADYRVVSSETQNFLITGSNENDQSYSIYNGGYLSNSDPEYFDNDRFVIHTYRYNGATGLAEHWVDGRFIGNRTASSVHGKLVLGVGAASANQPVNGFVSEFMIYDDALADSALTDVEVYLADKYGIYHPNAVWIASNYDADFRAVIHANGTSKAQADIMYQSKLNEGIPDSVFGGLERWYRPEELDADHSNGNSVGNWRDALGGDGMSIGTSSYQPHFRKPLSHGLPGLEFNSSTHRLHG